MESFADRSDALFGTRFVADGLTGRAMASALMRYRLTRPRALIGFPVIAAAVVIFGITQDAVFTGIGVAVLVFPTVTYLMWRQARMMLTNIYPAGSVHTTSFGPGSMTMSGPFGTSDLRYELFSSIWSDTSTVILRQRPTKAYNVIPAELVPPGGLDLIRTAVSSAELGA